MRCRPCVYHTHHTVPPTYTRYPEHPADRAEVRTRQVASGRTEAAATAECGVGRRRYARMVLASGLGAVLAADSCRCSRWPSHLPLDPEYAWSALVCGYKVVSTTCIPALVYVCVRHMVGGGLVALGGSGRESPVRSITVLAPHDTMTRVGRGSQGVMHEL